MKRYRCGGVVVSGVATTGVMGFTILCLHAGLRWGGARRIGAEPFKDIDKGQGVIDAKMSADKHKRVTFSGSFEQIAAVLQPFAVKPRWVRAAPPVENRNARQRRLQGMGKLFAAIERAWRSRHGSTKSVEPRSAHIFFG